MKKYIVSVVEGEFAGKTEYQKKGGQEITHA